MATVEEQREYQRLWMKRRRAEWFAGKSCIDCGSTANLELDHVDPSQKEDHKVWSWSAAKRAAETKKCVVRCHDCHKRKSARECSIRMKGQPNLRSRKLTPEQALAIRRHGGTERQIATLFGVSRGAIHRIRVLQTYREVGAEATNLGR